MVADFSKKQKSDLFSSRQLLKTAGILLIIIVPLLVFADFKVYQKKQQLNAEISNYKKQIQQIEKRNETLKEEIANSDNPDYIEKIAREEQDMQKPGEKVVSFVVPKQQPAQAQKQENFWSANFWFGWLSQPLSWIKSKF